MSPDRYAKAASALGYAYRHMRKHLFGPYAVPSALDPDDENLVQCVHSVLARLGDKLKPAENSTIDEKVRSAPSRVSDISELFRSLASRDHPDLHATCAPGTPPARPARCSRSPVKRRRLPNRRGTKRAPAPLPTFDEADPFCFPALPSPCTGPSGQLSCDNADDDVFERLRIVESSQAMKRMQRTGGNGLHSKRWADYAKTQSQMLLVQAEGAAIAAGSLPDAAGLPPVVQSGSQVCTAANNGGCMMLVSAGSDKSLLKDTATCDEQSACHSQLLQSSGNGCLPEDFVLVHGLSKQVHLNGRIGVAQHPTDSGRVGVRIDGIPNCVALRPCNLKVVSNPIMVTCPCCSIGDITSLFSDCPYCGATDQVRHSRLKVINPAHYFFKCIEPSLFIRS